MTKEFLEELQIGEEAAEVILQRHNEKLQQLQFDHSLQAAITAARGRNHKAITALLDLPALQENPEGLEDALKTLKQENGYLFEPDTPPVYARGTGSRSVPKPAPATLEGALREKYEKRK